MQTQREKVIKGVSLCSLRWTSVYRWRFIKSTIFPSSPPSSLSSLSSLYYLMVTFSRRIANLGIYPAMCSVCKPLHSELSYTQQSTSAHTSTHRHTHTHATQRRRWPRRTFRIPLCAHASYNRYSFLNSNDERPEKIKTTKAKSIEKNFFSFVRTRSFSHKRTHTLKLLVDTAHTHFLIHTLTFKNTRTRYSLGYSR